jgi:protein phosphatase
VVSEETLHKTLATVADLDEVVLQLIELAIRGGGPDNITCIVADVVDSATAPLPPSDVSVVVGAASNGAGRPPLHSDSPAGRAHLLTQTAPQAAIAVALAHDDPVPRKAAHAAQDTERRRRWPLVTTALAILLILILGGAYAGWRYTQSQYYVGADGGKVVIYRGIKPKVAWVTLSKVYQRTGIPLAMIPVTDVQSIRATIPASGLAEAQRIVTNIRADYQHCQSAYTAVRNWQNLKPTKVKGKVVAKPPEPTIPPDCPPMPASTGTGGTS